MCLLVCEGSRRRLGRSAAENGLGQREPEEGMGEGWRKWLPDAFREESLVRASRWVDLGKDLLGAQGSWSWWRRVGPNSLRRWSNLDKNRSKFLVFPSEFKLIPMCSSANSGGDRRGEVNGAAWKAFANPITSCRGLRCKQPRVAWGREVPRRACPGAGGRAAWVTGGQSCLQRQKAVGCWYPHRERSRARGYAYDAEVGGCISGNVSGTQRKEAGRAALAPGGTQVCRWLMRPPLRLYELIKRAREGHWAPRPAGREKPGAKLSHPQTERPHPPSLGDGPWPCSPPYT